MLIKNSSKKKYFGRDRVRTCDLPVISRTRYRLRHTDVELFFPIKKIFSLTLPTELFYFAKLKNIFGRDRVRTCDLPGRSRTRLPLRHTAFFQFSIKKKQKTEYELKPVRAEAASVNAHGRIRTRDLTVHNRVRYRCATWTCVCFLIEIDLKRRKKLG